MENIKSILESVKNKNEIEFILSLFKEALYENCVKSDFRKDIYSFIAYELPENHLLFNDTSSLFNEYYKHLDYSPIVN